VFDPADLHFFDPETGNTLRSVPVGTEGNSAAVPYGAVH
jgi:hypothetical protein